MFGRIFRKTIGLEKANHQIFCQDAKNEGLDIVEGLAPSKTEKEITRRGRAGNVGTPPNLSSFSPSIKKEG
jgi:hypothetical protein